MTLPSSFTISLPPTFQTSFWPGGPTHLHAGSSALELAPSAVGGSAVVPASYATYRSPLTRLYSHLQAGIDLNARLLSLVQHRAASEYAYAESLATPTPSPSYPTPLFNVAGQQARSHSSFLSLQKNVPGFGGIAGILHVVEQETQRTQAEAHGRVANLLETTILEPFAKWNKEHRDRVKSSWDHIDEWLNSIEMMGEEVDKFRSSYESKCRQADEAEDDARFAPIENGGSPLGTPTKAQGPQPVQDTINVKPLPPTEKDDSAAGKLSSSPVSEKETDPDRIKRRETLREQFGFEKKRAASGGRKASGSADGSNAADQSTLVGDESIGSQTSANGSFGGTSLKRSGTLSSVLSRLDNATRAASASPIVSNLRAAVGGLSEPKHIRLRKEAQTAEDKYRSAVDRLDRLRAEFEEVAMEHLGMTQRWEADRNKAVKAAVTQYTRAFEPLARSGVGAPALQTLARLPGAYSSSQDLATMIRVLASSPYKPLPQVFHPYYHHELSTLAGAGSEGFGMNLLVWDRARALAVSDAELHAAEKGDKLPEPPKVLRLLLKALEEAYANDKRWPTAVPPAAAPGHAADGKDGESSQSPALAAPAAAAVHAEKRRAWIYEVPLRSVHSLRFALIAALRAHGSEEEILVQLLAKADPPVLAALVKTWAMELEETLVMQTCRDMVWSLYKAASAQEEQAIKAAASAHEEKKAAAAAGADAKGKEPEAPVLELTEEQRDKIEAGIRDDLKVVLTKLPNVHLSCLDAIVKHLAELHKATDGEEADSMWLQKLGMSIGRALLRPPSELPQTIAARHPALMAADLVQHYHELFPTIVAAKAKETGLASQTRKTPTRRRTRPIDMRMSRTRLESHGDVPPLPGQVPTVAEPQEASNKSSRPTVETNDVTSAASEEKNAVAPTPIAERVLGGGLPSSKDNTRTDAEKYLGVDSSILDAIDAGHSGSSDAAGSTYGTPPAADSSLPGTDEKEALEEEESSADKASQGLSNVQKLSRQFGAAAASPSVAGPRGPRPAGAR